MEANSGYSRDLFTEKMDIDSVKVIVECGSRDCADALAIQVYYNADTVYAFECNPESILVCRKNIEGSIIKLIEKAVYNKNEKVVFYATDMEKSIDKNIGASSLLYHLDNQTTFFQKEIEVQGIRLDTFMEEEGIDKIDLLAFDLQGAENLALEGLGERIKDVHYLITEVSFQDYYVGNIRFEGMVEILSKKGFECLAITCLESFGDVLFVNKNWGM